MNAYEACEAADDRSRELARRDNRPVLGAVPPGKMPESGWFWQDPKTWKLLTNFISNVCRDADRMDPPEVRIPRVFGRASKAVKQFERGVHHSGT